MDAITSMSAVGEPGASPSDDEAPCPVETVVGVIGGKWKVLILWTLQERGTMRFAELGRAIGDVTQKVLSQQLRELERDGMIARQVYADVPPRVEYSLTPIGESLREPLAVLCAWGAWYWAQLGSDPNVIVRTHSRSNDDVRV